MSRNVSTPRTRDGSERDISVSRNDYVFGLNPNETRHLKGTKVSRSHHPTSSLNDKLSVQNFIRVNTIVIKEDVFYFVCSFSRIPFLLEFRRQPQTISFSS